MSIFYQLTNEEWIQAVHELKPRERDVLYYIRTLDPFGDRQIEIGVRDVSRILGCDPATVSRALKVLDQRGYIDLELINVQVNVLSTYNTLSPHNSVVSRSRSLSPHNSDDRHTTPTIATQRSQSEPPTQPDFQNPHTIQTNQTLKTLSVEPDFEERETLEVDEEELLKFTIGKVKQSSEINRPRAYAKKCLKDDQDFWIDEFVKWQASQVQIDLPPTPAISTDFEVETIEQKRKRLLKLWDSVPCRPGIRSAIETYQDLQLVVVEGELREVET